MAWVYVPIGILIILLACFGIDCLISLSSVSFPASVALLVALFFALILCDFILGERKTRGIVRMIEVPVCTRENLHSCQICLILSDEGRICPPKYKHIFHPIVRGFPSSFSLLLLDFALVSFFYP